jgi:hypothetical protein
LSTRTRSTSIASCATAEPDSASSAARLIHERITHQDRIFALADAEIEEIWRLVGDGTVIEIMP